MSDASTDLEIMMKEINAMKLSNDEQSNSFQEFDFEQLKHQKSHKNEDSYQHEKYSTLFENDSYQQYDYSKNSNRSSKGLSISEFCHNISQISNKNLKNFDDVLLEYKSVVKKKRPKSKTEQENKFVSLFNSKYSSNITDMNEIFDIVDDLKEKLNGFNPITKSSQESILQDKLKRANAQISSLMEQNKALVEAKASIEKSFSSVEQLLETQIEETRKISEQRNKLIIHLQTMDSLYREIDSNRELIPNPIQQSLLNQKQIIQSQESDAALATELQKLKRENEDTIYRLLASTYHIMESTINPSFATELEEIRDNSNKKATDRVLSMVQCVMTHYKEDIEKKDQLEKENNELSLQLADSKKQCEEVLHHFEDELRFLQKLSHSNDLQNVIFYRQEQGKSHWLTTDERNELIKKCAKVGKYIDENIGKLLSENVEHYFNELGIFCPSQKVFNPDSIFLLMQPTDVENKIMTILGETYKYLDGTLEKSSRQSSQFETQKLVDLLAAQVLMNDILTNYSIDLHTKITLLSRQVHKLDQGPVDHITIANSTEINEEIKSYKHQDKKIRKMLSSAMHFQESDDIYVIIKSLIKKLKQLKNQKKKMTKIIQHNIQNPINNDEIEYIQSPNMNEQNINDKEPENPEHANSIAKITEGTSPVHSFASVHSSKSSCRKKDKNSHSSSICNERQIAQLEEEINQLNSKLNEANHQHDEALKTEKENCQKKVTEIESINQQLRAEIESNQTKINENETIIKQQKNEITTLQNKLTESITGLKKLSNQYKKVESVSSASSIENHQLKNRIKKLEEISLKEVEAIKSKCNALRSQYEKTLNELQKTRDENTSFQQINLKLKADVEKSNLQINELRIDNKALALKIKTNDEKHQIELKTYQSKISANETSRKADIDHLMKTSTEKIEEYKNLILQITMKYCDYPDPIEAIKNVTSQLDDLRQVQSVYSALIEDVNNLHKLLNIDQDLLITPHVERLIHKLNEKELQNKDHKRDIESTNAENQQMQREMIKNQNKIASLIQWETWAKRVLRVIIDVECSQYSDNQLRQSLEEIVLSTVSNTSNLSKMDILRKEKQLMTRYEAKLLNVQSSSKIYSLIPILTVISSIKRLQKLAGCLPIDINVGIPKSNNKNRPKK